MHDELVLAVVRRSAPPRGQPQHGVHLPAFAYWDAVARAVSAAGGVSRSAIAVWWRWQMSLRGAPKPGAARAAGAARVAAAESIEAEEEGGEEEEEEAEEGGEEVEEEEAEDEVEVELESGAEKGKCARYWSEGEARALRTFLRAQLAPYPSADTPAGKLFWARASAAVSAASNAPQRGVWACYKKKGREAW